MGLFERDNLVRTLEELAERKAEIAKHFAGGRPADALAVVQTAVRSLAGPLAGSLDRLEGSSVVALIGKEKAGGYVELLRLEAQARAALGEEPVSRRLSERADSIARSL